MTSVPADSITIPRSDRQRRTINIEGLKESIAKHGVINPVIVRSEPNDNHVEMLVLVAGERRVEACRQLNIPVPIRFLHELSSSDAAIIELEENIKRDDLPWRDKALAIAKIHQIHAEHEEGWQIQQTCEALSLTPAWMSRVLAVARAIEQNNPRIAQCGSIDEAYNILGRLADRKAAQIVQEMIEAGAKDDTTTENADASTEHMGTERTTIGICHSGADTPTTTTDETTSPPVDATPRRQIPTPNAVLNANFLEWAPAYTGPKFNFIHCDFPYGVALPLGSRNSAGGNAGLAETYDNTEIIYHQLLDCLCVNLDKLSSYSAHIMFWISMRHYTWTVEKLRRAGLDVIDHPLIWYKSNGRSTFDGDNRPRHAYEAALLATRGNRPLLTMAFNCYAAPTVTNNITPTQKPESMLRHFFTMLVDNTTDMLDPTAGSGSALRAAEDLKARSVLGLEKNPEYAAIANAETNRARTLRVLNKRITIEEKQDATDNDES